jgi:XRE family aerobic/anaerobic benzoate catabolism transcriptional regulator
MKLAERIRKIRENKGLTQAEVADAIDITPSAYGQIERKAGNTRFQTLCKIADALSVKITFLIDIENPSYIEKTT